MRISNIFDDNNTKKTVIEESNKKRNLNIIVKHFQKLLDNHNMTYFHIKKQDSLINSIKIIIFSLFESLSKLKQHHNIT